MNEKIWYEIQVKACLDERWEGWFDHVHIRPQPNGQSKISGWMDQATVYGLLAKLRDLGIDLISITSTENHKN